MKNSNLILACLLITALLFFPSACALTPLPTPTATAVYSLYQLEYRLIAHYPDIFW